MLDELLTYISTYLNDYIKRKDDSILPTDTVAKIANVARIGENNADDSSASQNLIVSLVNLEEDKVMKSPENYVRKNNQNLYVHPKTYLNLYCLFSANFDDYEKALKLLSLTLQFFQNNPVMTPQTHPSKKEELNKKIEKLIFELISMNIEQLNQLWGMLGGKYIPSVLYKIRTVTIQDGTILGKGEPITSIQIIEQ